MADDSRIEETQWFDGAQSADSCESAQDGTAASKSTRPERIGRYRIIKMLGRGGFGIVYLAEDEQLKRPVAVKVPHSHLVGSAEDAGAYLAEARTVAKLDHSAIVPVHDVGQTDEFPCFVVSRYVEGTSLSIRVQQHPFHWTAAVNLVATIADALHYAHKQGVVHRDIKPGNILIGDDDRPWVVDFGLALSDETVGKVSTYAGTPAYMSPEQARGEGHRVDGRSDVFSLGVVLYELISHQKPFSGDTRVELIEQITTSDPRPLRQFDEAIPRELDRICQKAMSKRARDRYLSAHDFSDDLRHLLTHHDTVDHGTPVAAGVSEPRTEEAASDGSPETSAAVSSDSSRQFHIVPKGLRSYDRHDADFFLQLLPGPRGRENLPEGIRFWKTRVIERDADQTFTVGLIYGPSGCGKSSLMKAGLLPLLPEDIRPVYLEATPDSTESRLLHGLRKVCPDGCDELSLKDTLTAARQRRLLPSGQKLLIIIDQFEQWLHSWESDPEVELIHALRQCDAVNVQCILMTRDDFWLAATRFMKALEVPLLQDHNTALVDLFDTQHARRVLSAFGRAFSRLPEDAKSTTTEQQAFLKNAVAGLADDGKVVCVRLALFAEMMKGRPWTTEGLETAGGTTGIGVNFLDETFSRTTSNPRHRVHQKAARAVLNCLLPEPGSDIKGHMRSYAELLEASGYGNRPDDFDELVHILDREVRLITPTDPEGLAAEDGSIEPEPRANRFFQMTHDYLVHSLREWLTRKQKETRRGRAELALFDHALTWKAHPETRLLPSLFDYLRFRFYTSKRNWNETQADMMRRALWLHGRRLCVIASFFVIAALIGRSIGASIREDRDRRAATAAVTALTTSSAANLPETTEQTRLHAAFAIPMLKREFEREALTSPRKLNVALGLGFSQETADTLWHGLLFAEPEYFPLIVNSLREGGLTNTDRCWNIATDDTSNATERFRAACALATLALRTSIGRKSAISLPTPCCGSPPQSCPHGRIPFGLSPHTCNNDWNTRFEMRA